VRKSNVYQHFLDLKRSGKSGFAVLADPDKTSVSDMQRLGKLCTKAEVDCLFLGGSLLLDHQMEACIKVFREYCSAPVVLFPGSPAQVTPMADALLYLTLISGRNPDLLIGQHVVSAPTVKASGLEVLSTGYILVDGGVQTTVSYMSHSMPIPADKPEIALCTAWAGEMLGNKIIYLDAGSGANRPVSAEMIAKVSKNIEIPLIVGGGIATPEKVKENCNAGANIIVVGNAIEKDPELLVALAGATKQQS
jgi:phosphoglycerol geranylgeranyltransferase